MKRILLAVALCLVLAGSVKAAGGLVGTVEGTISLLGSEPLLHVLLTTRQGALYRVTGPAAAQLRSVGQGYVVRVAGILSHGASLGDSSLEAYQFKIVAAKTPTGEKKTQVGKIVVTEEETYLVTDELLIYRLRGAAEDSLREMPGARVCVVGDVTASWTKGRSLRVDFFNVLK